MTFLLGMAIIAPSILLRRMVEIRDRKSVVAIFLGMAVIAASIKLGRSFLFFGSFLAYSLVMTLLWRKATRPWVYLVSLAASTPVPIGAQKVACNLVFAFWYAAFNPRCLFRLPKWLYAPAILALLGLLASSLNWMSENYIRSILRQGTHAYNFFLAPFLLLPVVYLRMRESHDHDANLQGLLFCLIVPSTVILVSAKLFGSVANAWEASLHSGSLPEGFLQYQLGRVLVNFLRTEIGFILSALICASAAVTISQAKVLWRVVAGACLAANLFLLLATGSFGSAFACLCGLAAIFFKQLRTVSISKMLMSVAAIFCLLLLTYGLAPQSTKNYLAKRYEHRIVKKDTDRFELWGRAVEHLLRNPEGVGFTMSVGDTVKSYIHNDYLTYAVSYGFIGGLAYALLVAGLLLSFFRVKRSAIADSSALAVYLAGLGVIVAISVNSMTDHMNENRWYFNVMWSLIWYSYFCSVKNIAATSSLSEVKS